MALPLGFTGARLDRADQLRTDEGRLAEALADPRARCLAMDGIDFVPGEGGGLRWEPLDPADDRLRLTVMRLEEEAGGAPVVRSVEEAAAAAYEPPAGYQPPAMFATAAPPAIAEPAEPLTAEPAPEPPGPEPTAFPAQAGRRR